jgi:hypothetical protein
MPAETNAIMYACPKQPITVDKTPFPIRTEVSISSRRRKLKELVTLIVDLYRVFIEGVYVSTSIVVEVGR